MPLRILFTKTKWDRLYETDKAEYKTLHDEFIRTSEAMLLEYEESGSEELEQNINLYLENVKSKRATLEVKAAGDTEI